MTSLPSGQVFGSAEQPSGGLPFSSAMDLRNAARVMADSIRITAVRNNAALVCGSICISYIMLREWMRL